jgi:asparaginyl-tRNA synthetase
MDRTLIKDILGASSDDNVFVIGEMLKVSGRIYTVRFSGDDNICFIHLVDGSTISHLQCICNKSEIIDKTLLDELWANAKRGTMVSLYGKIILSPAKGQRIEMQVERCIFVGKNYDVKNYPLASRGFMPRNTLRQIPHLRHHTLEFMAIQRIKQCVYDGIHSAFKIKEIGEIQPTLLTSNECESGANPFTVSTLINQYNQDQDVKIDYTTDFFHNPVFLTVSSQLHLEATVCGTMMDGYSMTTAFRAEPSAGPLHLAEFLMPEYECVDNTLVKNMEIAEFVLKFCFKQILTNCIDELQYLEEYRLKDVDYEIKLAFDSHKSKKKTMKKKEWNDEKNKIESQFIEIKNRPSLSDRLKKYIENPFVITTHSKCITRMIADIADNKVVFDEIPTYDGDLTKQHERYITEVMYGGVPVFVTQFPKKIKAFYMPVIDEQMGIEPNVEHVDCFDLIFPYIGEVVGGSQRISDYNELVGRMDELNMDKDALSWYLDIRKYGCLPHGGAGIGFGRLMMVITGIFNIKDMQEFPRGYGLSLFG